MSLIYGPLIYCRVYITPMYILHQFKLGKKIDWLALGPENSSNQGYLRIYLNASGCYVILVYCLLNKNRVTSGWHSDRNLLPNSIIIPSLPKQNFSCYLLFDPGPDQNRRSSYSFIQNISEHCQKEIADVIIRKLKVIFNVQHNLVKLLQNIMILISNINVYKHFIYVYVSCRIYI